MGDCPHSRQSQGHQESRVRYIHVYMCIALAIILGGKERKITLPPRYTPVASLVTINLSNPDKQKLYRQSKTPGCPALRTGAVG